MLVARFMAMHCKPIQIAYRLLEMLKKGPVTLLEICFKHEPKRLLKKKENCQSDHSKRDNETSDRSNNNKTSLSNRKKVNKKLIGSLEKT